MTDTYKNRSLNNSYIDVWYIVVDVRLHVLQMLKQILAPDERIRAASYKNPKDTYCYTVVRGALRTILSRYTGVAPDEIRFKYGKYGKPSLDIAGNNRVRFNVSHAGSMALVAVAHDREVGVDIELIRPELECEELAKELLIPDEANTLAEIPSRERPAAFFTAWTRKEAYLKATGIGLAEGLDTVRVTFKPGDIARVIWSADLVRWSMYELPAPGGYVAALVAEGEECEIRTLDWPRDERGARF